jgi:drug/metabolite transporter (DMT)-like permease
MMNKKALRSDMLLLLTALLWGFGFVAQREGMRYVGPLAFNAVRFLLGSACLLPVLAYRRRNGLEEQPPDGESASRWLVRSSLIAGSVLFVAVMIQQFGLMFTTAGNAGFLTGLYVVLVPILGVCVGRKTGAFTWIGAAFTLVGMYFISGGALDAVNAGDVITIVSAFFWAAHVLLIDRLVRGGDPIRFSVGQFSVCGVLCLLVLPLEPLIPGAAARISPALFEAGAFEWKTLPAIIAGLGSAPLSDSVDMLVPILYGGLVSVGVAYTLQAVAQKDAPPAHATIILCLEGCFAALGGVLILHEPLAATTLVGFACMLAGMLVSQWEVIKTPARSPYRIVFLLPARLFYSTIDSQETTNEIQSKRIGGVCRILRLSLQHG